MATEVGALLDDALAAIFRALPPRSLAVVRCVCKAWRDVVDGHALLLRHLHRLPLTVRGVFINYKDHDHPHHLARPCSPSAAIPKADGTLSFLPEDHRRKLSILDHCNGLLLCGKAGLGLDELCVCNPATRRWTVLPRWWHVNDYKRHHRYAGAYIAFDPAESPHYQVVLVPDVPPEYYDDPWKEDDRRRLPLEEKDAPFCLDWFFSLPEPEQATAVGQWEFGFGQGQHDYVDLRGYMEWPPAPWTMRVFSSSTGRWEDKAFVREGLPAGTVGKMRLDKELHCKPRLQYGVYHHGSLYVHCRGSFVTRISLSKSKYQVIGAPSNVNEYTKVYYLGKLHNGVCFGTVHYHELKIWTLNEACGQMQWVLKYETVVGHYNKYLASIASGGRRHDGPWTQEENTKNQDTNHAVESLSKEGYELDSNNDDTFIINIESQEYFDDYRDYIIGFHPYKEVVFMVQQSQVVAYHLNSTKLHYVGNSQSKHCDHHIFCNPIYGSFLYTPCMIGDLLHVNQTGGPSSFQD